ncbi:MAG TPA: IS110 family transposase [Pirellulales bacterium]|nr:IS110 family transposase [Pirellulales bacterium]
MCEIIMVGCDLHDKTMLLKVAQGRQAAERWTFANTPPGRQALIAWLQERARLAGGAQVAFAYEASGQGFGLYDELTAAGFQCHVLAPTKMQRTSAQKKRKTDEKDAEQILDLLRAHVLAGAALPDVWIPDAATRDDRELVRARCDLSYKLSGVKSQIKGLLKRNRVERPETLGKGWTKSYRAWLRGLASPASTLGAGARAALDSLSSQLQDLEDEEEKLDRGLAQLSQTPRYRPAVYELLRIRGVGLLTAMVFLTEIGELDRFSNRRQLAAFLGLVPSSNETGQRGDCKGHITRQGPSRVRRVLCQAAWSTVRGEGPQQAAYQRIVTRNPKRKKVAVVAAMRRLAVRMWHAGRKARQEVESGRAIPGGRAHQAPSSLPPDPHPPSPLLCCSGTAS